MRTVEGFVCVASIAGDNRILKSEVLLGPNRGKSDWHCERFSTNGLTPFQNLDQVTEAVLQTRIVYPQRAALEKVEIASIRLGIADRTEEDIGNLHHSERLVIIQEVDGGIEFFGKWIDGVPGVCYAPVSHLEENGLQPLTDFEFATKRALYEVERQGQSRATLASWEFNRSELPE